ncbi:MAG: DUF4258 domain-containing protein [Nitrospirae bacterium]|nr:MAG: DUF4258 domain-containing protein [Nitrospirota bacterium]
MIKCQFSEHAYDLKERNIQETWVKLAMEDPERQEMMEDGTVHYLRAIEEYEGRYVHVVVNPDAQPERIVTVVFDRRIRRSP